ncbi:glycosyltransferase family 4 protein [Candidatus Roizmanbacteria bacterium]|nr:glycosyltransferase family 4 protein [Candidatus Roizmanbacteria bacterium]
MPSIYCHDQTASDEKSKVRGVGRYLQILKENFPDWLFTNKLHTTNYSLPTILINPFFNFLQPPLTMGRIARKQISVIHDLIPLKYPKHFPVGIKGRFNIFLNKLALRNYDLIITDSEASKRDIVSMLKVNVSRVKVIYPCLPKIFNNTANSSAFMVHGKKTTNYELSTMNYCIYVGDATWNKNLVNLAKAIKIINVTCVFIGKIFEQFKTTNYELLTMNLSHSWQQELKQFVEETKNDKRFIFAGFVPDEELIHLYQNARCNILVSRDEGFGFSYLEATSQGCPSVLSDIPVLKEISDSQGALFANPENPNKIANAIGELYFRKDTRNTLGIAAQKRSEYFKGKNFKDKFKKVLDL